MANYPFNIDDNDLKVFQERSKVFGKTAPQMLRDMVKAFNQGRLIIKPTEQQLSLFGMEESND